MKQITKNISLFVALILATSAVSAQTIVGWNAQASSVSLVSEDPNIAATNIVLGAGLSTLGGNSSFRPRGFDQATFSGAFAANEYLGFTITPDVGFEVTITEFTSNIWNSNLNPTTFPTGLVADLRISSDGFATEGNTTSIGTLGVVGGFGSDIERSLTVVGGYSFTTATEFRLYGISPSGARWNMGTTDAISPDITLSGTVAIPEPSSMGLVAGLSGLLFVLRRRRAN